MKAAVFLLMVVAAVSVQSAEVCPDVKGVVGPSNIDNGTYPVPEVLTWFAFSNGEGYTDKTYNEYTCITSNRTEKILEDGKVCQVLVVKGKPKDSKDYEDINTLYLIPEDAPNNGNGWHVASADCSKADKTTVHVAVYDEEGGSYRSSYTRWYKTEERKEEECIKHVVRIAGIAKTPSNEEIHETIASTTALGIDNNNAYYMIPRENC